MLLTRLATGAPGRIVAGVVVLPVEQGAASDSRMAAPMAPAAVKDSNAQKRPDGSTDDAKPMPARAFLESSIIRYFFVVAEAKSVHQRKRF